MTSLIPECAGFYLFPYGFPALPLPLIKEHPPSGAGTMYCEGARAPPLSKSGGARGGTKSGGAQRGTEVGAPPVPPHFSVSSSRAAAIGYSYLVLSTSFIDFVLCIMD